MKLVAFVTDQLAIKRILDHLGLSPPEKPRPPSPPHLEPNRPSDTCHADENSYRFIATTAQIATFHVAATSRLSERIAITNAGTTSNG